MYSGAFVQHVSIAHVLLIVLLHDVSYVDVEAGCGEGQGTGSQLVNSLQFPLCFVIVMLRLCMLC